MGTTRMKTVVGREYLMRASPSQATHPERCHARCDLYALRFREMAGNPRFWRLGRSHHLYLSIPSLRPGEFEAFPLMICDSVQLDGFRSQDWRSYRRFHAFHTDGRVQEVRRRYIPQLAFPLRIGLPSYGNEHILGWYFSTCEIGCLS